MKVIPLCYTQTNWYDFIEMASEVVGRSPMRSIDSASIKPGDPFSFLAALGELEVEGITPRDAVLLATHTLQHVSFSFMAHVNDREFYAYRNLVHIRTSAIEGKSLGRGNPDHLLLLSGTLLEWQSLLSTEPTTELTQRILFLFKQMNLRELFNV